MNKIPVKSSGKDKKLKTKCKSHFNEQRILVVYTILGEGNLNLNFSFSRSCRYLQIST